ncbi:hypothetical protein BDQ94DRAFT_159629 [Aspergillus welwitschiae]|uniref:Uncharacterized protein n=1 Tax=Aspergillus welwitschiae TaxID=1341132 RepID=A0A3F3Q324_9EURO|nr:hypothetical protein BDQ94DRAFT_159629 [Aspergillus welwitschiae]RDH33407.1 hypothetical protein BDQ94DRAFT_159629 [Aspergillus welwitschiae]
MRIDRRLFKNKWRRGRVGQVCKNFQAKSTRTTGGERANPAVNWGYAAIVRRDQNLTRAWRRGEEEEDWKRLVERTSISGLQLDRGSMRVAMIAASGAAQRFVGKSATFKPRPNKADLTYDDLPGITGYFSASTSRTITLRNYSQPHETSGTTSPIQLQIKQLGGSRDCNMTRGADSASDITQPSLTRQMRQLCPHWPEVKILSLTVEPRARDQGDGSTYWRVHLSNSSFCGRSLLYPLNTGDIGKDRNSMSTSGDYMLN